MFKYAYGQQPSDISPPGLGLGWLRAVRHLKSTSATGSFWHVHPAMQILYCIKGEFVYEFRELPPVVLTAGHLIAIPAGLEHRHLKAIDPVGHRIELLADASLSGEAEYSVMPAKLVEEKLDLIGSCACTAKACSRPLQALFTELDALAMRGAKLDESDLALARTIATLVLQRCAGDCKLPAERASEVRLVDEVLSWLEKNFRSDVNVDRIVCYMGYSRSRTFELFKERTGLTPANWITRRRIKEACDMLEGTDATAACVALACGFASPRHFNYVFRRQTGLTPSQWREQRSGGK